MVREFTVVERRIGTVSRVLLGLLFVTAGLAKAVDFGDFYGQLRAYPLGLSDTGYYVAAGVIVAFETVIGVGLLLRAFPRAILPLTFLTLLFFAGMTIWGRVAGFILECGCFGSLLRRSAPEAVAEDLFMFILTVLAWGFARLDAPTSKYKVGVLGLATVMGIGLPYLFPGNLPKIYAEKGVGSYVGNAVVEGLNTPLSEGEYLLAMIEIDSEKSLRALPRLNELAASSAVPRLVAICPNTMADLNSLQAISPISFPIGFMYRLRFTELDLNVPALVWVKSGVIQHIWSLESQPSVVEILGVCRNSGESTPE